MKKGFTLIEILVSVAIFSVVMVIALGALLSLSQGDRKAESIEESTNNLNFAVDSMARAIRTGINYHCGSAAGQDCPAGSNEIAFTSANDAAAQDGIQTFYRLDNAQDGTSQCGQTMLPFGCLERSFTGAVGSWSPITSPEVVINIASPLFYVIGSSPAPGDLIQPKVSITLSGYVYISPTASSTFNLQTTVTERLYDQ